MKSHTIHLNSADALTQALQGLGQCSLDGAYEITIKKLPKTRTGKQNRALHKWCRMVAEELNNGGYSVPIVLSDAADGEWDADAVKSLLWKKVQKVVIDKESTAEADRDEYTPVYDVLNRFLGGRFGVSVQWPSKETM